MCSVGTHLLRVADEPQNGFIHPLNGHSLSCPSSDDEDDVSGRASSGACAARRTSSLFAVCAARFSQAIEEVDEGDADVVVIA